MERINFEDGQLVKKGYVTIDGVQHEVTEAEYSGDTPLSAFLLNKLQDNIEAETNKIVTTTATTTDNGLMSSADKTKLEGIATGANKYILPTAGSSLGGVKTTSTVSSSTGYTPVPIINGVPYYKDTNTTYSNATTSSNGLMSSTDKINLDNNFATKLHNFYLGDNETKTVTIELNKAYLFLNSHPARRCMMLILTYTRGLQTDIIFKNANEAVPTITMSGTTLTVKTTNVSRGYLFKINNVQSV